MGATKFEWRPNETDPFSELWRLQPQGVKGSMLTGGWSPCPDFPHCIAAAWELVKDVDARAFSQALVDVMFGGIEGAIDLYESAIEFFQTYEVNGKTLPYLCAQATARDRTRAFVLAMSREGA